MGIRRGLKSCPIQDDDEPDVAALTFGLEPAQSVSIADHLVDFVSTGVTTKDMLRELNHVARTGLGMPGIVVVGDMTGSVHGPNERHETRVVQPIPPAVVVEAKVVGKMVRWQCAQMEMRNWTCEKKGGTHMQSVQQATRRQRQYNLSSICHDVSTQTGTRGDQQEQKWQ